MTTITSFVPSTNLTATPPALSRIPSPRLSRRLAWVLVVGLAGLITALVLAPWQQNITGQGRVVAFAPKDRQQLVAAPVSGRITEWFVIEGTRVRTGDRLCQMLDNDPDYINRIRQQVDASETKLRTAREKVDLYEQQATGWRQAQAFAVTAAQHLLEAAIHDVGAAEDAVRQEEADVQQKRLNYERQRELAEKGIASVYTKELSERDVKAAEAKLEQARNKLRAVQNYKSSKQAELEQKQREAQIKIDEAATKIQTALGDVAEAEKVLADLQVKLNRQGAQEIRAPRDGTVLRLLVQPNAEQIKAGDPLAILVPDAAERAVELWVDGNDAPLIEAGRKVRLQFEGWPAVQFAGWPSVAVGTFGGQVALVDATDNGQGHFRLLILPDPSDAPWPAMRFLRQGVRTNGWVLLDQVALWYEVWRQINGFPPVVAMSEPGADAAKSSKGKS